MKRAQLYVTPQVFADALKGGLWTVRDGHLPADARVVDVAYIHSTRRIVLVIESAAFRDGVEQILSPVLRLVTESRDQ